MSTCPRCHSTDVAHAHRETCEHFACECGWTWYAWQGRESRKSILRPLLELPRHHDPFPRWCQCDGAPARYTVNGTLGERVTYCKRCRKYVAIACPPGLEHGGHYRALRDRLKELAAMAKEGAA